MDLIEEKHTHQHCLDIIDFKYNNTKYYEEELEPEHKPLKIPSNYYKYESSDKYQLRVIPYDIINNIYKEVTYGLLVKEIDDVIYSYKRLVDNQEIELSDEYKIICN